MMTFGVVCWIVRSPGAVLKLAAPVPGVTTPPMGFAAKLKVMQLEAKTQQVRGRILIGR